MASEIYGWEDADKENPDVEEYLNEDFFSDDEEE